MRVSPAALALLCASSTTAFAPFGLKRIYKKRVIVGGGRKAPNGNTWPPWSKGSLNTKDNAPLKVDTVPSPGPKKITPLVSSEVTSGKSTDESNKSAPQSSAPSDDVGTEKDAPTDDASDESMPPVSEKESVSDESTDKPLSGTVDELSSDSTVETPPSKEGIAKESSDFSPKQSTDESSGSSDESDKDMSSQSVTAKEVSDKVTEKPPTSGPKPKRPPITVEAKTTKAVTSLDPQLPSQRYRQKMKSSSLFAKEADSKPVKKEESGADSDAATKPADSTPLGTSKADILPTVSNMPNEESKAAPPKSEPVKKTVEKPDSPVAVSTTTGSMMLKSPRPDVPPAARGKPAARDFDRIRPSPPNPVGTKFVTKSTDDESPISPGAPKADVPPVLKGKPEASSRKPSYFDRIKSSPPKAPVEKVETKTTAATTKSAESVDKSTKSTTQVVSSTPDVPPVAEGKPAASYFDRIRVSPNKQEPIQKTESEPKITTTTTKSAESVDNSAKSTTQVVSSTPDVPPVAKGKPAASYYFDRIRASPNKQEPIQKTASKASTEPAKTTAPAKLSAASWTGGPNPQGPLGWRGGPAVLSGSSVAPAKPRLPYIPKKAKEPMEKEESKSESRVAPAKPTAPPAPAETKESVKKEAPLPAVVSGSSVGPTEPRVLFSPPKTKEPVVTEEPKSSISTELPAAPPKETMDKVETKPSISTESTVETVYKLDIYIEKEQDKGTTKSSTPTKMEASTLVEGPTSPAIPTPSRPMQKETFEPKPIAGTAAKSITDVVKDTPSASAPAESKPTASAAAATRESAPATEIGEKKDKLSGAYTPAIQDSPPAVSEPTETTEEAPIPAQFRVLGSKYMAKLEEDARNNPTSLKEELEKRRVKDDDDGDSPSTDVACETGDDKSKKPWFGDYFGMFDKK